MHTTTSEILVRSSLPGPQAFPRMLSRLEFNIAKTGEVKAPWTLKINFRERQWEEGLVTRSSTSAC